MDATESTRDTTRQAAAGAHECHRPATDSSLPAARDSSGAGQALMDEVAATIRQVIRL